MTIINNAWKPWSPYVFGEECANSELDSCSTGQAATEACQCGEHWNNIAVGETCPDSCSNNTVLTADCECYGETCGAGKMCESISDECIDVCTADVMIDDYCICDTTKCAPGQTCTGGTSCDDPTCTVDAVTD